MAAADIEGIVQVRPQGPITRPEAGLPAIATLRLIAGGVREVPATVTAWTQAAAQVSWLLPGPGTHLVSTWIPAQDVHRGEAADEAIRRAAAAAAAPSSTARPVVDVTRRASDVSPTARGRSTR